MTYRRDPDSFAAATTMCADAVGEHRLAEALSVSASRVRQCANPMRRDRLTIVQAAAADIAAARAGAGTPHFDELRRRLAAAGVLEAPGWQRRFLSLPVGLRLAIDAVLKALSPAQAEAGAA